MDHLDTIPTVTVQALNATFGVLFIGFILAVILYGLTFFQTYVFYSRFPNDPTWTKLVVALLWLIDTSTTALISHMQYVYLIENFLSTFDELALTKTFVAEKALATVAIFIVQLFYATRLPGGGWHLITAVIGFAAVCAFAFGIASTVRLAERSHIADLVTPELEVLLTLYEGFVLLCDVSVFATSFYFLGCKLKGNANPDSSWFDRFVLIWVNRGASFSVFQLVLVLTFISMPHSQIWILFHFIISKCYINSLFSMLNFRRAQGGRGIYENESLNNVVQVQAPRTAVHPPTIGQVRQPPRNELSVITISRVENTVHSVQLPASVDEGGLGTKTEKKDKTHFETSSLTTPIGPSKMSL